MQRSALFLLALVAVLLGLHSPGVEGRPGPLGDEGMGTEQLANCTLALGADLLEFDGCVAIPSLDADFTLMWTVMPAEAGATTRKLHWGISGTTDGQGYVAVGFPARPGVMVGSNAFILQDCDDCAGPEGIGAKIEGYYLGGETPSSVQPPAHLLYSNLTAYRTTDGAVSTLAGSLVVELDEVVVSTSTNVIFAVGPISSRGQPLQHYSEGDADLALV